MTTPTYDTATGDAVISGLFSAVNGLFTDTLAPSIAVLVIAILALTAGIAAVKKYLK